MTHDSEGHVIPQGGDIEFTTDRDTFPADKIVLLDNGWVKGISKKGYRVEFQPPHKIKGIFTHTSDEEEATWDND